MTVDELRHKNFMASSLHDRATYVWAYICAHGYRVWSRKDIADRFGCSKPIADGALAILVSEGLLKEARYQRTNRGIGEWYFGYTVMDEHWPDLGLGLPDDNRNEIR